ncbi:MAG: FAD-dependent oxidoreductase [Proteobacteria bacterium]|nr:FAD-dependent oxidoreductase [Pseudomonadota bacterium]
MDDHLFTPLVINGLKLTNRICFLAHRTNFAPGGEIGDRLIAYYRRRAQGGSGLIILGELSIHPYSLPWQTTIKAYRPEIVADYQKLASAVHQLDTPIFAQLTHHGFQSGSALTRQAVWGPSPMSDVVFGETSKTMETSDIEKIVGAFSRSAAMVREGGFDGLEINMGQDSLLRQFLSNISNHRQDEYGGSLENRIRFPLQVLKKVRSCVGQDFPIGIRLSADEMAYGGIDLEESRETARILAESGTADFIEISLGTYYNQHLVQPSMHTPFGYSLDTTRQIKEALEIPVIAAHQVKMPEMGEATISGGGADAIGLVRDLICDPDLPRKIEAGNSGDIRRCLKDNMGCIGHIAQSKPLSCVQRPSVGYEAEYEEENLVPAGQKKRVVIVGGGPSGMEAALTAGLRGHRVTLYERNNELGGQINLSKKGAGRWGMDEVRRYLRHGLDELKIETITGIEATPQMVLDLKPDVVVVATGSKPKTKPIPGDYGPPFVLNVWEVLEEDYPVGERVLFIDENGGHHATATVEFLADKGAKVDMVTSELFVGVDLAPLGDLTTTWGRLLKKGVTFTPDLVVDEIDGRIVRGHKIYTHEPVSFEDYDTVVLDMGDDAQENLYFQLKGEELELYRIGDCVAPRGLEMAISEGRKLGESI